MGLDKHQVAEILAQIADILEIKGENPFKVRAYQNAARVVDGLSDNLEDLIEKKGLTGIKGIGERLAEHIKELALTGRLSEYDKLRKSVPQGIFEMLKIPGVGPKKVKALWEKLSIRSIGELEYACRENRLVGLEGFGEKTQLKILDGIAYMKRFEGQHLYPAAYYAACELLDGIAKDRSVIKVEIAGSIRRRKELIRDIDILAASQDPAKVSKTFVSLPSVEKITAQGETKSSVILKSGIAADLRVVSEREFPFALYYFTGSKGHNVAMRAIAKKKGLKLNEYGLFSGKKTIQCKDEAAIFEKLGLSFIPPELREDDGEIEAALKGKIPNLIEDKNILGIFHVHTDYSDGTHSVEEMAKSAKKFGFEYIVIADHSVAAAYANGLKPPRVKEQHREIERANKKLSGIQILKGIEADILPDGTIDYPDSVLSTFDVVIASIHSRFNMTEDEMTKRIIKAMGNRHVSILGHPTGRLLLARSAYPVNMHKIIDAASEAGVAIEINAHPQRLDLDWRWGRYAKSKGVKVVIGSDAHSPDGMTDMIFGVGIARKGWFEKKDVLNCMNASEVKKYFKNARK